MCNRCKQSKLSPQENAHINAVLDQIFGAAPQVAVPESEGDLSQMLMDVVLERELQKTLGFTPEHDLRHRPGDIAAAAVCYISTLVNAPIGVVPEGWPWDAKLWKPGTARENMVKAIALLLAEGERNDLHERLLQQDEKQGMVTIDTASFKRLVEKAAQFDKLNQGKE